MLISIQDFRERYQKNRLLYIQMKPSLTQSNLVQFSGIKRPGVTVLWCNRINKRYPALEKLKKLRSFQKKKNFTQRGRFQSESSPGQNARGDVARKTLDLFAWTKVY